ncbi:hypothetical protein TrCOL_g13307 [Triparma columacea]|uniref:Uncharacterized protein n=1 Tax=Triparma columacea TaxID=722753 RepID=A0A9W7G0I3_9STRA|nr:hypothetical protein TrCOL_g13307 [Triparma columacea]
MAQTGLSELNALQKYLNTAQSSTVMVNGFGFQERGGEEGEGEGDFYFIIYYFDEGLDDGDALRVIHGHSRGGSSQGREGGEEQDSGEEEDTYGDGDDDDDDGTYDDGDDDDDDSSFASSQVSFLEDGIQKTSTKQVIKRSHTGKVHAQKTKLKISKDIANRLPEKRRDVFHAKDRHGNLYIPPPIEKLFPEVIGTKMSTAKYQTKQYQYTMYEDPYRFGKTKEEIAAMDAMMEL